MARIQRNNDRVTVEDLTDSIAAANVWAVVTVTGNDKGATVSIRESHKGAMVDTIVLLLEQKEIYELVQKKIASVKASEKRKEKPFNPDVN